MQRQTPWRANPRRLWAGLTAAFVASAMCAACGASESVSAGVRGSSPSPSIAASPSISAAPSASDSSSASAATEAAAALVALAKGTGSATVPWGEHVTYYIAGVRITDLAPKDLPVALRTCPPGETTHEGWTCPLSPLKTIARTVKEGGVVVEPGAPTVLGCTNVTAPKGTAELTAATVRPRKKDRNCFTDFAVTLFTDTAGSVDTIQFTISGP
jgi:hypothetical protein